MNKALNPTQPTAKTDGNDTPERILIWRDKQKIISTLQDLKAACNYYNAFINRLNDLDLLPLGLTDEIVSGLCLFDCSPLIKALEEAASQSATTDRLTKKLTAQILVADVEKVQSLVSELQETMNREKLKAGLTLSDHHRATYLKADNGKVTFNPDDVREYFSRYAETPEALNYIAEARQLFDAICKFDEKTRQLSRGKVRGFGDSKAGAIPEIIAVYDGKITLDVAPVDDLFFKTENASKINYMGQYAVINPER